MADGDIQNPETKPKRSSAEAIPGRYDEQTRRWLSFLVATGVLGYVYLVTLVKTNLSNELESIVINAMLMFVTGILGYWIGSSLGSTTKGKMLSDQQDKP